MKQSRHSNYQNFVESRTVKNKNYINLDEIRFDWIKKIIKSSNKIKSITDIGSNLGYICLKFNECFGTQSVGYEYEKPTFLKANKIKSNKKNIKYINKGLNINNLSNIEKTDLLVHLNVLHHAGHMYDKKLIRSKKDWIKYSIKYLNLLTKKSKYLFFQTGNVNFNKNYFENNETFKILPLILKQAGWKVIKVGNIDFSKKKISYKTFNLRDVEKIPNVECKRDKKTNKVIYTRGKKTLFKYQSGFLQRPLFWCVSNNYK
tara:strand:- start:288 stop:1067 length:780 start_codon:yes stop_codon:yes gene_type:complete